MQTHDSVPTSDELAKAMMARMWRGWTTSEDAAAYAEYVSRTGLAAYWATPGNRGAWILQRDVGGRAGTRPRGVPNPQKTRKSFEKGAGSSQGARRRTKAARLQALRQSASRRSQIFLTNPTVSSTSTIDRLGLFWHQGRRFGASQGHSWGQDAPICAPGTFMPRDAREVVDRVVAQRHARDWRWRTTTTHNARSSAPRILIAVSRVCPNSVGSHHEITLFYGRI